MISQSAYAQTDGYVRGSAERDGIESQETQETQQRSQLKNRAHEPPSTTAPIIPTVEPLFASAPILELEDAVVDQGWEVGATPSEASGVMVGDDAVLEASLGLGPPPVPAGETVQRDPALTALLSAIRKDIDG